MKFFLALGLLLTSAATAIAQTGNTKPVPSKVVCKSLKDSASYTMGYNIGKNLVQQYGSLDPNMIAEAIKDVYASRNSPVDVNGTQASVTTFILKENQKKAAENKAAGKKFFDANAKKPGVITMASGLQYEVIKMGTGEKPTAMSNVKVTYAGTLLNGFEFDNSNRHGGAVKMNAGEVIAGWTEALQLMPVGSKFKLYIPPQIGYGDNAAGAIPPGSTLVFELELLEIVK